VMHFGTGATPDYLAKHGRPMHPRELEQHRCINYFSSKTGKIFAWDFAKDEESVTLDIPSCLAVNDSNAYTTAGLAGLGIMQIARYRMEPLVRQGLVEYILDDWVTQPLPINVVYPQNRHLSAKVRVFVEWVAELFTTIPHMQANRPMRRTGGQ
jgi:LysR family transcriptional regulator, regulator for bpeEF and oprC